MSITLPAPPQPPATRPGGPRPRIPLDPRAWRSPLRGPWLTSVFGLVLLFCLPVVILTGMASYIAYGPQYGQAFPKNVGFLHLPTYIQPTGFTSLYRITQGLHVALGLAIIPVVLAKLWSVIPKLFAFPPIRSIAQALERLSLIGLVGGILFELVTGVLNIQYDYYFRFDFYTAHYYGAWVFTASFVVHVFIKFPTMLHSLKTRRMIDALRISLVDTVAETADDHDTGLIAVEPAAPTMSRRGLFGLVGGASAVITLVTVGETVPGLRWSAYLSVRGQSYGSGPTDFQINRSASLAGIKVADTGATWSLGITNPAGVTTQLSRDQLLAMRQVTARLPIACVEGWSSEQTWTGVRLRDLEMLANASAARPATVKVHSLEKRGAFNQVVLARSQFTNDKALLALKVNGVDLSPRSRFPGPDHRSRPARRAPDEVGLLPRLRRPMMRATARRPSRHAVRAARRQVEVRFEQAAIDRWRATLPQTPRTITLTMPTLPRRPAELLPFFRRIYGDGPLQLLALIGCFALTGYAVDKARLGPLPERTAIWFLACFLVHDLVLFPLYALADRSLDELTSRLPRRRPRATSVVEHAAAVNAVRIPAALSLLLLLIFQGPIRHQGDAFFYNASHHHEVNYFARWLVTVGVLFLGSAVFYAARSGARRRIDSGSGVHATGAPTAAEVRALVGSST